MRLYRSYSISNYSLTRYQTFCRVQVIVCNYQLIILIPSKSLNIQQSIYLYQATNPTNTINHTSYSKTHQPSFYTARLSLSFLLPVFITQPKKYQKLLEDIDSLEVFGSIAMVYAYRWELEFEDSGEVGGRQFLESDH